MKSILNPVAAAAAVLAVAAQGAAAAPVPQADAAEMQLRALHDRRVAALAGGDDAFIAALAVDDFRMIDRQGARVDRAGLLLAAARPKDTATWSHDELRLRLFGEVALLHGVLEAQGSQPPLRLRYTDVFHWDGTRWRLVAEQHTPLRAGVGKSIVRGQTPSHAPWTGSDPIGDELPLLQQLNENYVKAFRDSNVSWYDAHLADDYVVSNGDGSMADRASALTAFARPSFATHFRSFPVDQVVIRRFADLALIEAENAYELKDGRTGISRYTDIWQLADGRWRCISAHITPFKTP